MSFAKHQTVEWLVKELKKLPQDAPITFATKRRSDLAVLSIYSTNNDVCLDIGAKDDE